MPNLNAPPFDKIMHIVIALAFAIPLMLLGHFVDSIVTLGIDPFALAAALFSTGLFYGKEVGEYWTKHKAEYPAGSVTAWVHAYTFFLRDKGSMWDSLVVTITMAVFVLVTRHG